MAHLMTSSSDEEHMRHLDKEQIDQIHNSKLIFVRTCCLGNCIASLFFQITFVYNKLYGVQDEEESTMGPLLNVMYTCLILLVIILIFISKLRPNSLNLVYPQVLGVLLRHQMSILDFEGKRFDKTLNT